MIKGRLSGSATATLKVTSETFAPNVLTFIGRNDASQGHAIGDFDADVTVGATSNSTTIIGFADIDVAAGKTLHAKHTRVGNALDPAQLQIGIGSSPGTGTFDATDLEIVVGDTADDNAELLHNGGTLSVSSKVKLTAGSVNAMPKFVVNTGATTSIATLKLDGGTTAARAAYLQLDASVDLTSTNATLVTGFAQASIGPNPNVSNVTLSPNDLQLGDGTANANFEMLSTSGSTGKISTTKLIINGGSGDSSTLTVSGGKIVTE